MTKVALSHAAPGGPPLLITRSWKEQGAWPIDFKDTDRSTGKVTRLMFLPRAASLYGSARHGEAWRGDEFGAEKFPEPTNDLAVWFALLFLRPDVEIPHKPSEVATSPSTKPAGLLAGASAPHVQSGVPDLTDEHRRIAFDAVSETNAVFAACVERRCLVMREMIQLAADGDLPTFNLYQGVPLDVPAAHWRNENLTHRFETFRYDSRHPFGRAGSDGHWLFVDRDALELALPSQPAGSTASAVDAPWKRAPGESLKNWIRPGGPAELKVRRDQSVSIEADICRGLSKLWELETGEARSEDTIARMRRDQRATERAAQSTPD